MKLYPACLLSFLILVPCAGKAEEFREEWYKCTSDDQCAVTTGACSFDTAVNKNYLGQVNGAASSWESCEQTGTPDPDASAKCVNNKCEITALDKHQ